jgi:hypothetical protein
MTTKTNPQSAISLTKQAILKYLKALLKTKTQTATITDLVKLCTFTNYYTVRDALHYLTDSNDIIKTRDKHKFLYKLNKAKEPRPSKTTEVKNIILAAISESPTQTITSAMIIKKCKKICGKTAIYRCINDLIAEKKIKKDNEIAGTFKTISDNTKKKSEPAPQASTKSENPTNTLADKTTDSDSNLEHPLLLLIEEEKKLLEANEVEFQSYSALLKKQTELEKEIEKAKKAYNDTQQKLNSTRIAIKELKKQIPLQTPTPHLQNGITSSSTPPQFPSVN